MSGVNPTNSNRGGRSILAQKAVLMQGVNHVTITSSVIYGVLALAIMGLTPMSGCQRTSVDKQATMSTELTIFHAGSLSVPLRKVSALFEQRHPEVTVKAEAAGSRDCARKISDLGRACDVLASADYKVVENLLMPQQADFNIKFATNEMALVYTERSNRADEIGPDNWQEILLENDVAFGRSDPNSDPCGYRTVMVFQLAEKHYGLPGLTDALLQKHGDKYIRPKETDLLALLEAGEIDYLFIYRSVGEQHGLKILRLPDEMNLCSPELTDLYATATVGVTGKRPGAFITRTGAPIVYSVTIPKAAKARELAEAYVALVLSADGQAIMAECGQKSIVPAQTREYGRVPASLQPFCTGEPTAAR